MIGVHSVDLAMIEGWEGLALRAALEGFDLRVNLFPIGRPRHLIDVLSGQSATSPHVVLSCHGDERGILLPELAPQIAKGEPFVDVLTPKHVRDFARLPDRTVVCTGCYTGTPALAQAFFVAGCEAYVAPTGEPTGSAALFFCIALYYHLAARSVSIGEAVHAAGAADAMTGMFQLFTE